MELPISQPVQVNSDTHLYVQMMQQPLHSTAAVLGQGPTVGNGHKCHSHGTRLKEVKDKAHPITCHEGTKETQNYSSTLCLTSEPDRGGWSTPSSCRFNPGNYLIPSVQNVGWAPVPVWTGAEDLDPPGFDSRTVQPVASRYTDCVILGHSWKRSCSVRCQSLTQYSVTSM